MSLLSNGPLVEREAGQAVDIWQNGFAHKLAAAVERSSTRRKPRHDGTI
jgi:hypothetical protein